VRACGSASLPSTSLWLFCNTRGGRVYKPLAGVCATGADAMALLASAAAGGCAACIVQLPGHAHAVALRHDQSAGEWLLLYFHAPGPRRLQGADALVGSIRTLLQADGEGEALQPRLTWPAVVACAS
jgi:hypothetical protein